MRLEARDGQKKAANQQKNYSIDEVTHDRWTEEGSKQTEEKTD
jgi:hypothetical protein